MRSEDVVNHSVYVRYGTDENGEATLPIKNKDEKQRILIEKKKPLHLKLSQLLMDLFSNSPSAQYW
jgi:hypothetical protein